MKKIILFIWNNLLLRTLLLIALLSALLLVGVMYWIDSYTLHNKAIAVPDVKSMLVEDASTILQRKGLRYQVVDSLYSDAVLPGAVVDQVPQAEMAVKQGRIIFLTINSTQKLQVTLPDVQDLSQRQAVAKLEGIGLEVAEIEWVEGEYKDLAVAVKYKQRRMSAGAKLPARSQVVLEVSKGEEETLSEESLADSIMAAEVNKDWLE